jgi:hypothetical protein
MIVASEGMPRLMLCIAGGGFSSACTGTNGCGVAFGVARGVRKRIFSKSICPSVFELIYLIGMY